MKGRVKLGSLTTEAIQGATLPLQCVYNIEGSDGLAASMLSVGDSISDDILQEYLQVCSRKQPTLGGLAPHMWCVTAPGSQ